MNASPAAPHAPAFDLSSLPSALNSQPTGLRSQQPSRPDTSRPDPVRSRIRAGQQRTHYETMQPDSVATEAPARTLHLLGETRGTGPRRSHPGDILFWVACLGGACLLILCATM